MRHTIRLFYLILLDFMLCGCSSITVHTSDDWGHPYAGTEYAINNTPFCVSISAMALFLPAPFCIADIPLSFVMDTVLLPADVIATPRRERAYVTKPTR